jgi:hypothetical protein
MPMTKEKVIEAVQGLVSGMALKGFGPHRLVDELARSTVHDLTNRDAKRHLKFMAHEILKFLEEGRREKAMRWLGFMQGVAWARGDLTLEEVKELNKPDGAAAE